MTIKAEFVNPFLSGAITTLRQELRQEPTVGQVSATISSLISGGVSVLIGLTGQIRGVVVYDMEERTAKGIASAMAGVPVPILDAMAESAIAELGNVITGLASSELESAGYQVAISPPSVIIGRGTHLAVPKMAQLMVPLVLPQGMIRVYLALYEGA